MFINMGVLVKFKISTASSRSTPEDFLDNIVREVISTSRGGVWTECFVEAETFDQFLKIIQDCCSVIVSWNAEDGYEIMIYDDYIE